MGRVVASAEVETWQEDGPSEDYQRGEPYSYRGSTGGRVSNVTAHIESPDQAADRYYYGDSCGVDLDVEPGDTVYAVVADFSTGDSFGHEGGQAQVLDILTDPDEASDLAAAALSEADFSFEHSGKTYSRSWVGYFERLNSLDVWEVRVRRYPSDPWTTDRYPGFKVGR